MIWMWKAKGKGNRFEDSKDGKWTMRLKKRGMMQSKSFGGGDGANGNLKGKGMVIFVFGVSLEWKQW